MVILIKLLYLQKKQCFWWCEITALCSALFWRIPILALHPSPCCSFALSLVGKMVIRYILICSSRSTAQLVFFLVGDWIWQIVVPCLFTTLSLQQILVNGRLVDKYPNEWTWTMDAYDARLLQKNPKDLLPPTSKPSLITSQRLSVTFFSSNPFYHPLRHGMHRRDRNLGIFLITQVITICCWIDSHRGPNIPQWNRQENSAYIYIYIWRLASYRSRIPSLKFIHVFQSRNVKREMFKTRWPWFCSRLVAENHWDYLYNLKIQVFFHYKEFCIIQLSLIGNFCRSLGAVHVILFWARNAQMSILDLLAWLQLSTSL